MDATTARRGLRAVVLVSVLALLPALGVAVPAAAAEPDWTVRTAANDLGADRSNYAYTAAPGDTVRDGIVITNRGSEPLDLALSSHDLRQGSDGRLDVAADSAPGGVGAWARGSTDRVEVRPDESVTVPITVAIPEDAAAGDYAGAVLTSVETTSGDEDVTRRLGIRMTIRVTGDLTSSIAVEGVTATWEGALDPLARGAAVLRYTVRNTGNMQVVVGSSTSVSGPFGWQRGAKIEPGGGTALLPGARRTVTVRYPDVAGLGSIDARASVTAVVTDAAGTTTELQPVVRRAQAPAVPWATVALLLVVLALAALLIVAVVRRRARGGVRLQRA
jgi:hypothetical protein